MQKIVRTEDVVDGLKRHADAACSPIEFNFAAMTFANYLLSHLSNFCGETFASSLDTYIGEASAAGFAVLLLSIGAARTEVFRRRWYLLTVFLTQNGTSSVHSNKK